MIIIYFSSTAFQFPISNNYKVGIILFDTDNPVGMALL